MADDMATFCHSATGVASAAVPDNVLQLPFRDSFLTFNAMGERIQKPAEPAPWAPKQGDGDGPKAPDISRPDTKDLLQRMRKVDPNQAKRYRQRTGQ